jgi:hypothetical protein
MQISLTEDFSHYIFTLLKEAFGFIIHITFLGFIVELLYKFLHDFLSLKIVWIFVRFKKLFTKVIAMLFS